MAQVRVSTGGADADDAGLVLHVAVVPEGGAFPGNPLSLTFLGGQASHTLSLSGASPDRTTLWPASSARASLPWKSLAV